MAIRTADGVTRHSGELNTAPSSTLFWTDTLRCVEYILNGKIPAEAVQLYDSKIGRKSDREFVGDRHRCSYIKAWLCHPDEKVTFRLKESTVVGDILIRVPIELVLSDTKIQCLHSYGL